jgi:hypothetical protein
MKEPQDSLPPRWQALVAEARRDQPPDLDPQAVLRTLRTKPGERRAPVAAGWWPEFAGLFGSRSVFASVALATVAFCAVAVWQTSVLWDAVMPWAELMAGDESFLTGGLL